MKAPENYLAETGCSAGSGSWTEKRPASNSGNTASLLELHDSVRTNPSMWKRVFALLFWSAGGKRWLLWDMYAGGIAAWSAFNLTPYGRQPYGFVTGIFFGLIMGLASWISGIPRPESGPSRYQIMSVSLMCVMMGVLLCMFAGLGIAYVRIGRWIWLIFGVLSYIGIVVPRIIITGIGLDFKYRIVVYGSGSAARAVISDLGNLKNIEITGCVADEREYWNKLIEGVPCFGGIEQLAYICRKTDAHFVTVAVDEILPDYKARSLLELRHMGIGLMDTPRIYEKFLFKVPIDYISATWLFSDQRLSENSMIMLLKRLSDIVFSMAGLLITAPFWWLIALAIKLDSPGPVIFRQWRMGYGNRPFKIIKFRTMQAEVGKGEAKWTLPNDARITKTGRFLRKTRIDEIPQLINVLKGEMSMVGPRPERPEFVSEIEKAVPFYAQRYLVAPGITGWAQVKYRYGASVEDARTKLEYDLYYIRNLSFRLDLQILLQTVVMLMKGSQ